MICPKLQFEIVYSPILNFSQVYREKIASFARLANKINVDIASENSLKETMRINFVEEEFAIHCSLDRIIFVTQGDLERFIKNAQSPIRIFFNMLTNISQIDTFDKVKSYVYAVSYLNPIKEKSIVESFSKKFLHTNNSGFSSADYNEAVFAKQNNNIKDFIVLSTYNQLFRHEMLTGAFPFDKTLEKEFLENDSGYHFYFKRYEELVNEKKVDFNLFKKLVNESYQTNQSFFNENN